MFCLVDFCRALDCEKCTVFFLNFGLFLGVPRVDFRLCMGYIGVTQKGGGRMIEKTSGGDCR